MHGVGVGEQQQAVTAAQALEESLRDQGLGKEDAAPHFAEAIVFLLHIQDSTKLLDEILGGDLAGFEVGDQVGGSDSLRGVLGG